MNGIDIYEGDNITDWNLLKQQGVQIVIQKATQGISHIDSLLRLRYSRIKAAGLKFGIYHFADKYKPEDEAQHFLNTINGLESDTVLWLDVENEGAWTKSYAIAYSNAFINYIHAKGFKIGIYTGASFYMDYLIGNVNPDAWWIADYGKQPSTYPNQSWQYSETGKLNGAIGNLDLDNFTNNIFISSTPAPPVLAPLPVGFNEAYYLQMNDDVAQAVEKGEFKSGAEHYQKYGWNENRKCVPQAIISYAGFVQNVGLQDFVQFSQIAGTVGEGLRMEGLTINYSGAGNLTFEGHVENIGWQAVRNNGEFIGTIGECLRLEAIKIHLEDSPMKLSYSVHVENIGWMDYVQDDEIAGTVGQGLRIEAVKIKLM
jgi:GH25 family lysozyme M1 (1,4-beta-N-acetylmuramidase)